MDQHGMIKLGENIKPETLYGKKLGDLSSQNQHRQVAGESQSAACQGKFIDNRMEYLYHNGIYDIATREMRTESIEKYSYLPALIGSAKIFYNATKSIGKIYEKSYSPKVGTFHMKNDAWRLLNYEYLKNQNLLHNVVLRTEQTAVIHGASKPIKYENATVDNYLYTGWTGTPELHFIPPIGIGILPLLSNDGNHENSILNVMVETGISVETESHGGNILYTAMRNPQPNPCAMGYMALDHKFSEIIVGHQPLTSSTEQQIEYQPEPTGINVEIAGQTSRRPRDTIYDDTALRQETENLKRKQEEDEKKYNEDIKKLREKTNNAMTKLNNVENTFNKYKTDMENKIKNLQNKQNQQQGQIGPQPSYSNVRRQRDTLTPESDK